MSSEGPKGVAGANKKVEALRTALIAIERAMGKPISAIAEKYKLSTTSVKKELSLAEESGFIEHYKAMVHDSCVPAAIAVYESHLALGNLEAARDIMQGLGIFQKQVDAAKLKGKVMETFNDYKAARAAKIEKEDSYASFSERPN